jgi:hypothetical protein
MDWEGMRKQRIHHTYQNRPRTVVALVFKKSREDGNVADSEFWLVLLTDTDQLCVAGESEG